MQILKKIPIRYFYIAILISKNLFLISQGRVIFNNNSYLVIQNSAQLVVQNSNANAITINGSGGNIISEGENNVVNWKIGSLSGTYTIPFASKTGVKIPLTFNIIGSGTGSGNILFSTYGGSTWDNSTYLPSDVTSFSSSCCVNNSANVIDRFWIIDAKNFATKPSVNITFTYIDAEHTAASNIISESTLFAQRFNPAPINDWGDWLGQQGTANTSINTVESGTVSAANFFRSWTLVNQSSPLPIELKYFNVICSDNSNLHFVWETASENNNNFFTIEESENAIIWNEIAKVNSIGNSSAPHKYYYTTLTQNKNPTYYRLKQTDKNEKYTYSQITSSECATKDIQKIAEYPNPAKDGLTINLNGYKNQLLKIEIINTLSQVMLQKTIYITDAEQSESFDLKNIPPGIYTLSVNGGEKINTKTIIIQ